MSDGLNLTGFNETKPSATTAWPTESYTEAPAAAAPAADVTIQGEAGSRNLSQGGK